MIDPDLRWHPSLFDTLVNEQRPILQVKFPTLAFHFFSVGGQPDRIAIRITRAKHGHVIPWPFAKVGIVGDQQHWVEVDMATFPDDHFIATCALIA